MMGLSLKQNMMQIEQLLPVVVQVSKLGSLTASLGVRITITHANAYNALCSKYTYAKAQN